VPEIGALAVALALAMSALAAGASAVGFARGFDALVVAGRRAMLGVAVLVTIAVAILVYLFVAHDFSVAYVWQTSSATTPALYLLTGIWGGQSGSLLFWSWVMALFAAAALVRPWRADASLLPPFTAVCATVTGFFLFLVTFLARPFERLAVLPLDGNGLNPLLQHPGMALHPPMLYLGFTGMVIPYAFAVAALATGQTDATWIQASRRWLLVAWAFLTIGLALGGRWAYDVLGWGGYWGWDPVENAALMPWIAATAFLHSVMVQERRGVFRVWNMALIILTFSLVIVGTFLTRAGLVTSVHSFAESDIGPYFLVFTGLVIAGSLVLLWRRLPDLRATEEIDTIWSREGAFLANNVVFIGALFGVFWGTLYPLFSEILTGQRVSVTAPYFNRVVLPMLWLAIVLMAVAPLIAWRRADPARLARVILRPLAVTVGITLVLAVLGVRNIVAVMGFGAAILALLVTVIEIGRGVRARMARGEGVWHATRTLVARNRRRYGGYVVHIGVALLAMGVVGSNVYQVETERTLGAGETMSVGRYTLAYRGADATDAADRASLLVQMDVSRDGRALGTLAPRRDVFRLHQDQPVTIPAILHRPMEDVYVLLGTYDEASGRVTIKALVNPLITWVWIGLVIVVAGTIIAAWPGDADARALNAELGRLTGSAEAPRP
jgi:cytochrome c-type biogenesis protein CcmF